MKGTVVKYNEKKAFGFIEGEDKSDYFFHITHLNNYKSKVVLKEGMEVVFHPTKTEKGKRANNIRFLRDYRVEHLKKRLTKGKKSKLVYKGTYEEKNISEKFSQFFGITFSREEKFKSATYYFNFLQPSEVYRESFNMFNEVLMLFSPFSYYDKRAMDYVDKLFMDYSNRLDPVVIILISKDRNIREIVKKSNTNNDETRIIVPFSYDEILEDKLDTKLLQNRLREYFYQRDLFAMESPLKSDNYFYGRSNIVHNFFDKYSIGEQTGLFGLRKTGKTSVLFAVERLVDTRKGMSIFIDCQSPGVYNLRWFELLEHIITRIQDKYSLKLESLSTKYNEKNASECFLKSLKEINKIRKKRILMIFDEIEHITFELSRSENWTNGEDFLSFWQTIRSIIQSEQNLCSFIIAGVNPKITENISIKGFDNPIFNNVSTTYLDLFSLEDVREMIGEIGSYMGLSFEEPVYFKLHSYYGGHPFLIRNVCSILNSHFTQRPYKVTNRDFDDYKEEIDTKLISYIKSILFVLQKWYPGEFDILKDIALENKKSYTEKIKHNELSIVHLLGYGIVHKSNNNNYYIEIDAIKNYMNSNYKNEIMPNSQDEFREVISSRRNNIELKLRTLVKQTLMIKYGKDKLNDIVEKKIKVDIDSVLKRREDKNLINSLYFSELKKIILSEYPAFNNIITMEIALFNVAMDKINKYRHVDAHAGDITKKEYNTLHLYFTQIEEMLENF
ncbi:cold shock domain-containing protein [Sporosalibacterium faouarense]|uniref:cold shock domain-containing protein n=1 Tax=Sporosalibacterium faouarense TaxID=516123 RepID=UPI00192C990E|nr:cold shock domain-containing protein [Sporosalibacterium faouarense]